MTKVKFQVSGNAAHSGGDNGKACITVRVPEKRGTALYQVYLFSNGTYTVSQDGLRSPPWKRILEILKKGEVV